MFVETPLYIRYVVLTILIFTFILSIDFQILHNFDHFMDIYLITYISLSLTGLWHILLQDLRSSGHFVQVPKLISW